MPRPTTTSSENDQSSVVNDQQPKEVEGDPKEGVRRLVMRCDMISVYLSGT